MYIVIRGQFLYIGKSFITESPSSANLVNIVCGDEIILDINNKMRKIFKENCTFKMDNCIIKISSQNMTIENYNKNSIDLFELSYAGAFFLINNSEVIINAPNLIFVEDVDNVDVLRLGKLVQQDKIFPQKCNVEFVEIINK